MMKIRVLHIVGIMNMGGIENLLMNIYRKIDRSKVQFDFLVTREDVGIFDEEIRALGGRIYNIPSIGKVGVRKYQRNVYDFFNKHKEYKIVHCHRDALCSLYLKEAKRANIPIRIAHSHNIKLNEKKNLNGILTLMIKQYFKYFRCYDATDYFACSEEAAKWLFGKRKYNKSIVLNNGIDVDRYIYDIEIRNNLRQKLGIDENTFVIGNVGRFNLQKNHLFLIEIFKELKFSCKETKLILVGTGEEELFIRKQIKKYNLIDDVIILSNRKDVNELMMIFDVFLFPSLFEGLGIVLIEAQASGLPCIVSDKIPKEAFITQIIKEVSLSDDKNIWVKEILKLKNKNCREDMSSIVKNKGFDIGLVSKYIEQFYIDKNDVKRMV